MDSHIRIVEIASNYAAVVDGSWKKNRSGGLSWESILSEVIIAKARKKGILPGCAARKRVQIPVAPKVVANSSTGTICGEYSGSSADPLERIGRIDNGGRSVQFAQITMGSSA